VGSVMPDIVAYAPSGEVCAVSAAQPPEHFREAEAGPGLPGRSLFGRDQ
jgi:hypothetical protein